MATSTINKYITPIKAGDVLELGASFPTYMGLVTSAHKFEFDIPISRTIEATAFTINNLFLRVWKPDGTQVINAVDVANDSDYTVTYSLNIDSVLGVKLIVENQSLTFGSQGQPIQVNVRNGTKLTFM